MLHVSVMVLFLLVLIYMTVMILSGRTSLLLFWSFLIDQISQDWLKNSDPLCHIKCCFNLIRFVIWVVRSTGFWSEGMQSHLDGFVFFWSVLMNFCPNFLSLFCLHCNKFPRHVTSRFWRAYDEIMCRPIRTGKCRSANWLINKMLEFLIILWERKI